MISQRPISQLPISFDLTGGGTTYSVSLTEAASAADSVSASRKFNLTLSEAADASDSVIIAKIFLLSLSEAAHATDAISTLQTIGLSLTEVASGDVSLGLKQTYGLHLTEAADATDSPSAMITLAVIENANAADDWNVDISYSGVLPIGTPTLATDVYAWWSSSIAGVDFVIDAQDLASHRDLITSCTLSLFCNRRALDDEELPDPFSIDRGGWWGSTFMVNDPNTLGVLGSRLWLLSRTKSSPAILPLAQGYVQEALQWVLDRNVAVAMDIDVSFLDSDPSKLGIVINIERGEGEMINLIYQFAWNQLFQYSPIPSPSMIPTS